MVLVSRRGQLMRNSQASGAMAAILATESQVAQWCAQVGNVWIAAVNSPTNMTIAGTPEALAAVIQLASRAPGIYRGVANAACLSLPAGD